MFPDISIQRGLNEKTITELRADMADKIKNGFSPHPEIITLEQKFSIPASCLVFALVGLALGMSVARDGKLAGFVVGIAVIFAYYIVFLLAESLTKGHYANPRQSRTAGDSWRRTWPAGRRTSCCGVFGLVALIWRARYTEGGMPRCGCPTFMRMWFDRWRREPSTMRQIAAAVKAARPDRAPARGGHPHPPSVGCRCPA